MGIAERDFREWEAFAKKLASKYVTPGVDLEDLEQEALLTVLEELPKYAVETGVSLKVFLGRGIKNKLASLYRKALNLVQVDQFWVVCHKSGDKDLNVRVPNQQQGQAVMLANPGVYACVKHVKVRSPIGPSLDDDSEESADDETSSLHERVGNSADQEWQLAIAQRASNDFASSTSSISVIMRMRKEGHTFSQIGKRLGKSTHAVMMAWRRSQGKAA